MGKIVAVTNQKGGVGKTTTAANLSALVGSLGQRVLIVDIDPQGNATSGLGAEAGENSIYEALMGRTAMAAVLRPTDWPGLDIASGDIRLAGAEVELVSAPQRESRLRQVLTAVRDRYDFIFVDCPPSLGLLTLNALTAADSALIPIQCEYYALEGLGQILQTISIVRQQLNPELKVEGVVFTMYDQRTNLCQQVVESVRENLKEHIFETLIPRNIKLAEAPSFGLPITRYEPQSRGADSYRMLAAELMSE